MAAEARSQELRPGKRTPRDLLPSPLNPCCNRPLPLLDRMGTVVVVLDVGGVRWGAAVTADTAAATRPSAVRA